MMKFIRAGIEDAKILTEIKVETFDDDSRRFFNRPAGGPQGYDSMEAHIKDIKENIYYKIVDDNKIIGGFYVQDMGDNHFYLANIFIKPSEQGRGIGQKAIKFLEAQFPDVTKWTLDTPSVCVRNQHLYEKMGYKRVNKILLDKGTSLYLYLYEKTI